MFKVVLPCVAVAFHFCLFSWRFSLQFVYFLVNQNIFPNMWGKHFIFSNHLHQIKALMFPHVHQPTQPWLLAPQRKPLEVCWWHAQGTQQSQMEIILKKSQTCTIILEYFEFQLSFQILNVLINHFRLMMVQSTIIFRSWLRAQHGTSLNRQDGEPYPLAHTHTRTHGFCRHG